MQLEAWMALAVGVVLGYSTGWHRAAAGLPLGRKRTPRATAAAGKPEGGGSSPRRPGAPPAAPEVKSPDEVRTQVRERYPHLSEDQVDAAADEIARVARTLSPRPQARSA